MTGQVPQKNNTSDTAKKKRKKSFAEQPWFIFLLIWSVATAVFLPIAEKVGYWTSAFPAGVLIAAFGTVIFMIKTR